MFAMVGVHPNILVVAGLLATVYVRAYDFEAMLQMIPEHERSVFLKHHLTVGYDLTTRDIKSADKPLVFPDLPADFSVALYQHALREHAVHDEDLLKAVRDLICFPNGQCIDLGDTGVHPKNNV